MIRTLIPEPVKARAKGRRLGYALTTRALLLLLAGCVLAVPGFFHFGSAWIWPWAMVGWDALIVLLILSDALMLPPPAAITVERRFLDSPSLGEPTKVELEITQQSHRVLDIHLSDAASPALESLPLIGRVRAFPRDPVSVTISCIPNARGDVAMGKVHLRYRGALELVERWAQAGLDDKVRIYPPMERSPENSQLYLLRIRQIALQKRKLRLRGLGREFESLREYQRGDEVRNIAWPATARRGKLITREFTTERSQQVWIVLDAGRLSRTGLALRATPAAESAPLPNITQLDQSTGAAVALAQAVMQAGDKAGLLVYGRNIQQQLLPALGAGHVRQFVDSLSQARAESGEANHLHAAARLKHLQRRRGLILWITELADSARRPEIVDAVMDLARRHLVLLVVLGNPELDAAAMRQPRNVEEMFVATAASEVLERRRTLLARLRSQGILVVETTPDSVKTDAINRYLEIKSRGLI